MSEQKKPSLWDAMVPEDAERLGQDILDPVARKRWCGAILFGGLPYLWKHEATVPRELAISRLELQRGDRVLIVGEAVADIGFDAEIAGVVGPGGDVVTVDMRNDVLDLFYAGQVPKWEWEYTREYPDEHFDGIFVGQGVAHAGDWKREGAELLRVLKSGRRIVLAEISFSETFYTRVKADIHIEYWLRKLMEGVGDDFYGLPYWNLDDVAAAFIGAVDDLETFEWRGVDLMWGRRP
jgi:SAM-dependent methyltransferase